MIHVIPRANYFLDNGGRPLTQLYTLDYTAVDRCLGGRGGGATRGKITLAAAVVLQCSGYCARGCSVARSDFGRTIRNGTNATPARIARPLADGAGRSRVKAPGKKAAAARRPRGRGTRARTKEKGSMTTTRCYIISGCV